MIDHRRNSVEVSTPPSTSDKRVEDVERDSNCDHEERKDYVLQIVIPQFRKSYPLRLGLAEVPIMSLATRFRGVLPLRVSARVASKLVHFTVSCHL